MRSIDELKEILKKDFDDYVKKYLDNLGSISESAKNSADFANDIGASFLPPRIDESDTSTTSSTILSKIFPAPSDTSFYKLSHSQSLKNLRDGELKVSGEYRWQVPGWKQYYDSLSKARTAGYRAIFQEFGLSHYIMTKPEYQKYVDDLRSSPAYGNSVVEELIKNKWLENPETYTPAVTPKGGGASQTRGGQVQDIAEMLWHWEHSKKILAFIDSYRWFPHKKPADIAKRDSDNNSDRKKAYSDDFKIISETADYAYGKVDSSGSIQPGGGAKFQARYNKSVFMAAVDLLYKLELELAENNSTYGKNIFKDLLEGDRILRRKRSVESLLDKEGKLDPKLFENKFWEEQVEHSWNKFLAWSKKPGKKGYKTDKDGKLERDKDGELIIIDLTDAQWIEEILSGSQESFMAAIKAMDMAPVYRAWRTDPGGLPAVQFAWEPDPEILREIFILKAYPDDPNKVNDIIYPRTPVSESDAPKSEGGGILRKIFGEKVGFKSGESTIYTHDGVLLTPELRRELREERRQKRVERREKREESRDRAETSTGSGSTEMLGANIGSSGSESSIVGGATNITNINNQTLTGSDQNKTINEGSNILNSQDNKNLMVKNEVSDSSGSGGGGSSTSNISNASENKSTANINNISTVSGSDKSVDLSQSNPSISNTQNELSQSINNSKVAGSTDSSQSSSTTVTNSNPSVSGSSINNQNESNLSSSNIASNITTESRGSDIKVDRSQVNVSNLKSNNVNSESMVNQTQNPPVVSGGDISSASTVNNVTNEGAQTAGNVTNNTDNSMSKTPIIQNNIDMSEVISRLKRIEDALLSPLEVKVIES
jgi:hypothetical protein